jgi:alpha(1,3/1,4) fucosyltransferase
MKTIRIGFKYFWGGFTLEEFLRRYPYLTHDYNLVETSNPDFLCFGCFWSSDRGNFPDIKGDFVRIFFGSEEGVYPDMTKCEFATSAYLDISSENHFRIPHYLGRLYWGGFAPKDLTVKVVGPWAAERQFCNFIYSNNVFFRNSFCLKLSKYKPVTSVGGCIPNAPQIALGLQPKLDFIKNFKFTIAFENCLIDGNASEKITEPMLMHSMPIYWGNKRINEDFNTKSFINYHDFKNEDALIDYIVELDKNEDLYVAKFREPWYVDNTVPPQVDENKILEFFRRIFG